MRKFWAWLGYQSGRRAGLVSLGGLLVTLLLGLGVTQLHFKTGTDSYLNKSDQAYKDDVRYEDLFGGQAVAVMFTMPKGHDVSELLTAENLAKFDSLEQHLQTSADGKRLVFTVITPSRVLEYSNALIGGPAATNGYHPPDLGSVSTSVVGSALLAAQSADPSPKGQAARAADTQETVARLPAASTWTPATLHAPLTNRAWAQFLLFNNQGQVRLAQRTFYPNRSHALLIVRLHGNQSIDQQSESVRFVTAAVHDAHFQGVETTVTGAPSLLKSLNDYLKGGMLTLGALAAAIMVVLLLVAFRVRWRLLPLAVILVGLVWAFGLAGYLHIPLTLATIAGLPTLMGVGIDYAIQMHARVEEEVLVARHRTPVQETARNLCPALLVVTFDAVFAFAALTFAKVPMIRQFGFLLAVGIAMICLCSIVMPLATLGMREYRSPTKRDEYGGKWLSRIVVWLGELPARAAIPFAVVSVLLFFGGILVEGRLVLQTDPIEWVNPHSQVVKDIHALQDGTGSSNEMGVFVHVDRGSAFNDATVKYIDDLTTSQLQRNGPGARDQTLATANSIVEVVSDVINDIPGASHVAPKAASVLAAYGVTPPEFRRQLVSSDLATLNVVFRTSTPNLKRVKGAVDEVRSLSKSHPYDPRLAVPSATEARPSGLAVVGVGLLENLESNRILLTYLSIAFVGIFLAVRMRSIVRSLLSLVPVLIAVGTASLVAFGLSLKLSPMTAVGGPLVVAVCTEFTSLILLRFVEERARGLAPKAAIDVTAARTGRAFLVSAMTAIAGVLVMATSTMPVLRGFGIVVGMNVAVALLAALVVLPPMLVWADEDGRNWVSRGMVDRLRAAQARERAELEAADSAAGATAN
ncbi:MAG TPA: MMPL family transporter [Acidimicrobiales bacterium]|nr:MMPL family transporter [Acidimicrobiales bacterium]